MRRDCFEAHSSNPDAGGIEETKPTGEDPHQGRAGCAAQGEATARLDAPSAAEPAL